MSDFLALAQEAETLSKEFLQLPVQHFSDGLRLKGKPGIYALFEGGTGLEHAVYVGRTRNLAQRFRAHITPKHNAASFALKRTRTIHGIPASYSTQGTRAQIANLSPTRETFLEEIAKIREMNLRFLEVEDPTKQYLLELAVTMAYKLSLDGFDSH